ncbi:MAG: hypothetical protein LBR30_05530 [Clostridioides sp.]|jgi:hypothetical protein|nr:hypothetical protein [Clostridioides sp.]
MKNNKTKYCLYASLIISFLFFIYDLQITTTIQEQTSLIYTIGITSAIFFSNILLVYRAKKQNYNYNRIKKDLLSLILVTFFLLVFYIIQSNSINEPINIVFVAFIIILIATNIITIYQMKKS